MKQVNCHTDVEGNISFSITRWSKNGFVGRTTDTVYSDGVEYTDWCVFTGTDDECQEYIKIQRSEV